jgi:hypothetical protein
MATDDTPTPARTLTPQERADVLNLAIPAHLATLDPAGFPCIIPIWFLWEDGIFYLSSGPQSRHVQDLARDPRAGLCITVEEGQTEAVCWLLGTSVLEIGGLHQHNLSRLSHRYHKERHLPRKEIRGKSMLNERACRSPGKQGEG